MSDGRAWLHEALMWLASGAVLVGAVELALFAAGRRRALPGYGWETEVAHLAMNAIMAMMMTALWSAGAARIGAALLAAAALLLAIVSARDWQSARADRDLIVVAALIHVAAALLMAWLLLRMAPMAGPAMAMLMPMASAGGRPMFERIAGCFFLFDLAGVMLVTAFADQVPQRLRRDGRRLSILPHVAMDTGMIAMLLIL